MNPIPAPPRTLTQIDHVRLERLLGSHPRARDGGALEQLIALSDLVPSPAVAADVVTMSSRISIEDAASGVRQDIALCYPAHADAAAGRISVLAPLGTALLGLRVGDLVLWDGPDGAPHAVRILRMLFQPEAAGDYTG